MAEGIKITIDDPVVLAELDRLQAAVEDIAPAEHAIGAYLVTSTQRRFERETGPDGAKWPRLSPRTANKRIGGGRRGYDHMLRVSGRLQQSIFYDVDGSGIHVGTNVVYAAIQQFGGTIDMPERQQTIYQNYDKRSDHFDPRFRKRSRSNFARDVSVGAHQITIPARPYLGLDEADRAKISEIIADHIDPSGGLQ